MESSICILRIYTIKIIGYVRPQFVPSASHYRLASRKANVLGELLNDCSMVLEYRTHNTLMGSIVHN
jgi:hypothetical protein